MEGDGPPTIGGSLLFGAARDLRRDQLGAYRKALEDHGGQLCRFHLGPPKVGIEFDAVFTPDAARQVLATDNAHYDKEVPAFDEFRWVMGDGLITSDGDRWRRDRRTMAPLFTKRRIGSYVADMAVAADRVADSWTGCDEVDVERAGRHYALDVLGRAVFGADVESLAGMLEEAIPLLSEFAARRALSVVRIPASWPAPANRKADAARQRLFRYVDDLVGQRRAGSLDGGDLLTLLLTARDPETGDALDDRAVRDQALTFLVAGHETTGATLAFALHLLARHPAAQDRVRAEAASVAGDQPIGSDHVERLRYAAQVVDETMRLYPAGHTVVRHAHDPTLLGGHEAPAGRIVAVSVWGVHHNPDVWPDPYRFDPDRFASEPEDRYTHLPFGGGPRACIGQHLASAELVVALATLLRTYRLEADDVEPAVEVGATIRPPAPLLCRATMVGTVSRPGGRGPVNPD